MLPSLPLRRFVCRLTLFTRANCGLCDRAKSVLSNVWDKRPFEYDEVDVMQPTQQKWKDLYEFDTPVVSFLFFAILRLDNAKWLNADCNSGARRQDGRE